MKERTLSLFVLVVMPFLERRDNKFFFNMVWAADMGGQGRCIGRSLGKELLWWLKSDIDKAVKEHISKTGFGSALYLGQGNTTCVFLLSLKSLGLSSGLKFEL